VRDRNTGLRTVCAVRTIVLHITKGAFQAFPGTVFLPVASVGTHIYEVAPHLGSLDKATRRSFDVLVDT